MKTEQVEVDLPGREYQIEIGTGNLSHVGDRVAELKPTRCFLLYDANVVPHWKAVEDSLHQANLATASIQIPAGESSKSLAQAERLWDFLVSANADRRSMIIAIGGGVVGDLAGFVAAAYARGIPFFQVPTTLLAQVDSSVGGKTGINLAGAKNMVGAFWQPRGVVIDTATLATLNPREYISGLAEVIKYGVIMDAPFFDRLEANQDRLRQREDGFLTEVIAHCCRLKSRVVLEDEHETSGLRAILNYGHTFAHAIETVFGYGTFLHGEAVSIGMCCAANLARRLGRVDAEFEHRQRSLLANVGLPVRLKSAEPDEWIEVMRRDKKTINDVIRFILPTALGHVEMTRDPVDPALVRDAILSVQEHSAPGDPKA